MRKLYTDEEIVLCTYIAKFGRKDFDENHISLIENRSVASIKMKVQNIAAMLQEEGFAHSPEISVLSGVTTGQSGRRTNWNIIEPIAEISKEEHLRKCKTIINFPSK